RLAVLVRDFRIPAHFAKTLLGAQRLLLAREAHLDAIARLDRLREAQAVDPIVGQDRSVRRIDEQASPGGNQEVPLSAAPTEQRIAAGSRFVHVGVERVTGELGESLDIGDRHLAFRGVERISDLKGTERLPERMHAWVELPGSSHPSPRY